MICPSVRQERNGSWMGPIRFHSTNQTPTSPAGNPTSYHPHKKIWIFSNPRLYIFAPFFLLESFSPVHLGSAACCTG